MNKALLLLLLCPLALFGGEGDVSIEQADGTFQSGLLDAAAIGAATAAEGELAETAVQPGDLASGTITPAVGNLDLNNLGGGGVSGDLAIDTDLLTTDSTARVVTIGTDEVDFSGVLSGVYPAEDMHPALAVQSTESLASEGSAPNILFLDSQGRATGNWLAHGRINLLDQTGSGGVIALYSLGDTIGTSGHYAFGHMASDGQPNTTAYVLSAQTDDTATALHSNLTIKINKDNDGSAGYTQPNYAFEFSGTGLTLPVGSALNFAEGPRIEAFNSANINVYGGASSGALRFIVGTPPSNYAEGTLSINSTRVSLSSYANGTENYRPLWMTAYGSHALVRVGDTADVEYKFGKDAFEAPLDAEIRFAGGPRLLAFNAANMDVRRDGDGAVGMRLIAGDDADFNNLATSISSVSANVASGAAGAASPIPLRLIGANADVEIRAGAGPTIYAFSGAALSIPAPIIQSATTEPADPAAGESVQWVSDGTGIGDAGDIMVKINVSGTVKSATLVDWSAL